MATIEPTEKCRIIWWVYTGGRDENGRRERIRRVSTMRGFWPGYDVECATHGWETRTGGAVRSYIEQEIWEHKWEHGTLPSQQKEV